MVGKGEAASSRIFQQCYVRCCKLQNLTPLGAVLGSGTGALDFCVDRIKYADWPPILNALSADLSLHSVAIKCRQQVKTVLEHIDCERLAKTVNKRAVILTKFMLSNLVEALAALLADSPLLAALLLEGLPLRIPYLNPLCEALVANSSLQHLHLPRCAVGDAGCAALCSAVRGLPNILTLDLTACDLTPLGAGYIADLIKYQKIHRYSENWVHTLRYRLPELDAAGGLRRVTLSHNPLGDAGLAKLFDVLADDLWIKALDVQNCGASEALAAGALRLLRSNTALSVLDLRANPAVPPEALAQLRAALRHNERGLAAQYSWLSVSTNSSDGRSVKSVPAKNAMMKDRGSSNVRNAPNKYLTKTSTVKKEREYAEVLEEQLREEAAHRRRLEELNLQLAQQLRQLRQERRGLWAQPPHTTSSGSERSASSRSGGASSSSASSVPIDHNTLHYIQQAFRDIYAFIKNNQCNGECVYEQPREPDAQRVIDDIEEVRSEGSDAAGAAGAGAESPRVRLAAKRAQSTHGPAALAEGRRHKVTKSAHLLGDALARGAVDAKRDMIERHMGDTKIVSEDEHNIMDEIIANSKGSKGGYSVGSSCGSVSDSSDTLVYSPASAPRPAPPQPPNPRDALVSSSDEDDDQ